MRINPQGPVPPPQGDFSRGDDEVVSPHDLIPDRPGLPSGASQLTSQEEWATFTAIIKAVGREKGS